MYLRILVLLLFPLQLFGNGFPDQDIWNDLLEKYVSPEGKVNYKGFISEKDKFDLYLTKLSNYPPAEDWSRQERLAYWINAYNAFTIKLIIENYPIESITDLHPTLYLPLVNTVWHKEFFQIGGEDESLNDIEHKILRKDFNEPRIHFAIVCASESCPKLKNEAFIPEKIESQLEGQAREFINDPTKNRISKDQIEISRIFQWFKGDFTKQESLIEYLNRFSDKKISDDAKVRFMDYDWSLNE
jgi:hypothetical protein